MKALLVTLLFPVLLKSCEGVPDQTGTPPLPVTHAPGSPRDNANTGDATNGTTDVPFDAGLSILLIAGAGYGMKRYRKRKDSGE